MAARQVLPLSYVVDKGMLPFHLSASGPLALWLSSLRSRVLLCPHWCPLEPKPLAGCLESLRVCEGWASKSQPAP